MGEDLDLDPPKSFRDNAGEKEAEGSEAAARKEDSRREDSRASDRSTPRVEIFLSPVGRRGSGRNPLPHTRCQMQVSIGRVNPTRRGLQSTGDVVWARIHPNP